MKFLQMFIFVSLYLLLNVAVAETEAEEMQRLQQQLNNQVFGFGDKPSAPEPSPTEVAPEPVPAPVAKVEQAQESAGLPVTTFTAYKLAGVNLGMEESAVYDAFKAKGYVCKSGAMAQMYQMTGRIICFYPSSEAPKIAMIGFGNGVLRDIEVHETYKTGFPEEIYKRAKNEFMSKYGSQARCKAQRRGEICEVFGHGYRILLRSENRNEEAKIIRRVGAL